MTAKLGDIIEIHCRNCRLNLDASVSALNADGTIAKVQCRTCRHFVDYKAPVPVEEKRAKLIQKAMRIAERHTQGRSAPPKPKAGEALSQEAVVKALWEEATKGANPLKSKFYDPHKTFAGQDLVTHRQHGLGVVQEVGEDSVLVLFREGLVRLDHARPREDEE